MLRILHIYVLGLASALPKLLAYPHDSPSHTASLKARAEPEFVLAAIGDSWGSGVTWNPDNQYDDNSSGCMRYKLARSTVVNATYSEWAPDNSIPPEFEFKACSGAHLENMEGHRDQLTRPKLVLMEAGGNNADFYPMADACLFQASNTKDYGSRYEDDTDPQNRKGECRKEIDKVRASLQGNSMQELVTKTIHMWRGHKSVMNNGASLLVLGYARFFGTDLDDACDKWNFAVPWRFQAQNVVKDMRAEFNELLYEMNHAIRQAVESFDDDRIQYVDIDPAFQGHRFCEKGHSKLDQYNWGNKVYFWNNPAKWITIIRNGKEETTYDPLNGALPPQDIIDKLKDHVDGIPRMERDSFVLTWNNPAYPDFVMEWKGVIKDFEASGSDGGGLVARTLHPTEDGHREMGNIIVQQLKRHYKPQV